MSRCPPPGPDGGWATAGVAGMTTAPRRLLRMRRLVAPSGAYQWSRCAVAGDRLPSPDMKKLLILAVLVALGVVAAKRLRGA